MIGCTGLSPQGQAEPSQLRPLAALGVGWIAYALFSVFTLGVFVGVPIAMAICLGGWLARALVG